jgi:poly(A) polymerase
LQQAIDAVFEARIGDISGRGKLAADMREIWQMQPRLERRTLSSAPGLIEQPRFRAGFDFLRLRADVDEIPQELAEWWEDYSLGTEEEREALLQALKAAQTRRVAGVRSRGAAARDAAAPSAARAADDDTAHAPPVDAADATDRRRRRRRRRGGRAAGESDDGSSGSGSPGPSGASSGT